MQNTNTWEPFIAFFDTLLVKNPRKRRLKKIQDRVKAESFVLDGRIVRGRETLYAISGIDVIIDEETWMFGKFEIGARARVTGIVDLEGFKRAKKVIIKAF